MLVFYLEYLYTMLCLLLNVFICITRLKVPVFIMLQVTKALSTHLFMNCVVMQL